MSIFQTFNTPDDDALSYASAGTASPVPASPAADPWRVPRPGVPWRWLAAAVVPLAVVYLSMLNRYWVPSGDGEVYTCIARSLVQDGSLTFNGSRAAIAPPGWPLVLSLAMRVSPEFLFLKLVTTTSMLGALAIAFFVVRRFLSDRAAAGTILLTGTLSTLYPLTFWMHTEAFFCLLGFGAILIAFRVAERRAVPAIEVPLMLLLLGFGAFTRWPGVLHMVLVVPILLSGHRRPWARPTRWVTVALACVVCVGTFLQTRSYLSPTKEERRLMVARGQMDNEGGEPILGEQPPLTTMPATTLPTGAPDDHEVPPLNTFEDQDRGPVAELAHRFVSAGKWFSWLLWQPTRFGQSIKLINVAALTFGWLTIALLAATTVGGVARRNFFWLGLAAYTGGLCILWPNPNARYFVPVAPFIVAGVFIGIAQLNAWIDARLWHRRALRDRLNPPAEPGTIEPADRLTGALRVIGGWKVLAVAFVAATLASNLPLLAIEVSVFRSSDFYGNYEAGSNKELIAAAQVIRAYPKTGAISVSERYENMGRARWSKYGMRALHLLTDRPIIGMQRKQKMAVRPSEDDARRELNRNNADYYVFQSEWKPWRLWHLRLSPSLQKRLTGRSAFIGSPSGGWELYTRRNAKFVRVATPDEVEKPTRVPGL